MSAWQRGTAAEISELYTEDAFVLYPDQPAVSGRAAIFNYFKGFFGEFPKINASYSNHEVIYRSDVNLGIAVALDHGLIVPVIKQADELSLVGLAKRLNDLATRARNKQLKPDDIQGGTFTITNPGIFGTTIGFPIINQPQVAILGVGGVEMRAAVVSDEYGNHAVVPRKRGFISLGYDHRLVNGADGDQFLARIKQLMETFPDQA